MAITSSPTSSSFATFDALLCEEVSRSAALAQENDQLRALLCEKPTSPTTTRMSPRAASPVAQPDSTSLLSELKAARLAQEEMARELAALRASRQQPVKEIEDHSSEVSLLRESLAALASELESEKTRVAEVERKRVEEEQKVTNLRATVEESRRALLRFNASPRRQSMDPSLARRPSQIGMAPMLLASSLEASSRRRSSLCNTSNTTTGLGLADSVPFRLAHHRNSASVHTSQEMRDEDDRLARLRDLRYGVQTTKIASRRGSAASSYNGGEDWEPTLFERRRLSSLGATRSGSVSSDSGLYERCSSPFARPPSAPLRAMGRKQSMATFDTWGFDSRRSSIDSSYSIDSFDSNPRSCSYSTDGTAPTPFQLIAELDSLRIALAESEEGRRATQVALKALKQFVGEDVHLPPLPVDVAADEDDFPEPAPVFSRWSIPRLPSLSRRGSATSTAAGQSPNLTIYTPRRSSSTNRNHHHAPPSTSSSRRASINRPVRPSMPTSFGSFSFAERVVTPGVDEEGTSPKMTSPHSFADVPALDSASSESESSRASSPDGEQSDESPYFEIVRVFEGEHDRELMAADVLMMGKRLPSTEETMGSLVSA